MEWPVSYTMQRIKHSEILSIFRSSAVQEKNENAPDSLTTVNSDPMQQLEASETAKSESFEQKKLGIKVSDYLRYNSVLEEFERPTVTSTSKYLKQHYHCENCGLDFVFNVDDVHKHFGECSKAKVQSTQAPSPAKTTTASNTAESKIVYFCPTCHGEFSFSKMEILKHIASHKK